MAKPTVGIFSLTSCSGCQLEILNNEDILLDMANHIKIIHFPIVQENNNQGPYDISFVEGSITNNEQIEKIKHIREKSKFLVAIGACAVNGGVQSIRRFMEQKEADKIVYKDNPPVESIEPASIDKHVKVDYNIRGCPINKEEFVYVLKELLIGKTPKESIYPVCIECREKENECLLQNGKFCMGPITYGGCGALCPSDSMICNGCRGPIDDATMLSEIEQLEKDGIKDDELHRLFTIFTGKDYEEAKKNEKLEKIHPEREEETKKKEKKENGEGKTSAPSESKADKANK